MKKSAKIVALKPSSHSCFWYEDDDVIVSVYSRHKKKMRKYEINTHLDLAKAHLIETIRGK